MYLKPASLDTKVPDPARAGMPDYFLPPEGREVEESFFWHRRLRDGDVVLAQPPVALAPAPAPAAPAAAPAAKPSASSASAA